MAPSPKAVPPTPIKAPLSPPSSSSSSSFSSSSLPIRAPPSSDDGFDEENDVENQSRAFSDGETSSDSGGYLTGGEDDFETASERPFVADPDEETLEIPAAAVESEAAFFPRMPIAQVTVDDEEDIGDVGNEAPLVDVDGDGFSGVVRVFPPLVNDGLEWVEGLNPSSVGETGTGVFGVEEKEPSLEGDSSVALENCVRGEDTVGNSNSVDRVLGGGKEDYLLGGRNSDDNSVVVEEAAENSSEVSKGETFPENHVVDENVNSAIEEISEFQSIESNEGIVGVVVENGVPETLEGDSVVEKITVLDGGSGELNPVIEVRNDNLGNSDFDENECVTIVDVEATPAESLEKLGFGESKPSSFDSKLDSNELVNLKPKEDYEMQAIESGIEKIAVLGNGAHQESAIDEGADSEFVGAVTSTAGKIDSVSSEEDPKLVTNAVAEVTEQDSHDKPGFEVLEANSNELLPVLAAAGGENSIPDNCQTFPAKPEVEDRRYESQTVSCTNESVEHNVIKAESQPTVAENSEDVEVDREILGSSPIASGEVLSNSDIYEPEIPIGNLSQNSVLDPDVNWVYDDSQLIKDDDESDDVEDECSGSEEHAQGLIFRGSRASQTAEQIIREMEHASSSSQSFESSQDYVQKIDGKIMTDSDDEEVDSDEEADGKELYDAAALAALLKAASSAGPDGSITINAPDAARIFSAERPAGLGPTLTSLKPGLSRTNRPNIFTPSELAAVGESDENMNDEEKKMQEKILGIRVKFLRLLHRVGQSPDDTVAAQVLYRLGLAEGMWRGGHTNRAFSFEGASMTAMQMEAAGADDLDFSCNILILGKTGVGKSATINSIFGEEKTPINAFEPSTTAVKEIIGTVDGIKIRVIDTPGLRSSVMDQSSNMRILLSIKKQTKKCPPDIVLYVDRLDTQTRDFNDLPLLRSINTTLGSSIWLNAIVALTHAASAPPDGPNGLPLSYEVFVAQRSHIVQQSIRQAAGDMRLMNPVALVENHPSCRRNRVGQRVLPNGQNWRPQLLLLCYSSKILSEANSLLKPQDPSAGKLFGFRVRSPPLPYLLSSLLQSRAHPKLSTDMSGDNVDSDNDLDDLSDSDHEEEDEYDQLPPFKPLKKSQIANLSKEQRKAYFDEYDYRVKLLQKKQWREELQRLREIKKRGKDGQEDFGYGDTGGEDYDQENDGPAAVPVPSPDMVLPPSFDGDNPAYRYRFLEPTSQLLVRPVLETNGWDHDCGYDGVSLQESLAIAKQFPAVVAVQITKDKREFNIHLDSSIAAKHGESGSALAGFDIQNIGKQLAYILRGETKFDSFKKNRVAAGLSFTFLGENVATGFKVEDQISISKRMSLVATTGFVRSQGDVAYGANLEARLRDKEFPIGQDQSTLGLSLMKWRGDLALGANLQSQFSVGRNSKMAVRIGLNNKLSGQITVRTSSSEQLQIALVGILPVAATIFRTIWPGEL
ncbi:translocase of chloroplast 159, chloroplastic [Cinnamomum micranthum f. kanehirae]|uniref:Translocase of chloroplast 159, chloroplastic n=1 Tax=Cinnamomum micranthum f. kanehirae TaxID=337451 RepID=A0A3S3NBU1_9MAGN|nr:translocase of chloroplast 159, chloroplastic [Cinnamomum micranthum f. kanehirae]